MNNNNTIFISYSHKDKKYLESFRSHFTTIRKEFKIWDDSKIKPSQKWKIEIDKALETSIIGILFLSADFLNSKFIMEKELPYILESAKNRGLTIFIVNLRPVLLDNYPELNGIQAINSPNYTILEMNEPEIERIWVKLAKNINSLNK